jgi:hypothetical protein
MCRPVRCRTCAKTTWAGCGQHIDQVRSSVPAGDWCRGHDTSEETAHGGWLRRLISGGRSR